MFMNLFLILVVLAGVLAQLLGAQMWPGTMVAVASLWEKAEAQLGWSRGMESMWGGQHGGLVAGLDFFLLIHEECLTMCLRSSRV